MPYLSSAQGSLKIDVAAGSTLRIYSRSGTPTVTGSTVPAEDATATLGCLLYGPQTFNATITVSTTGVLEHEVVIGDPTPVERGALFFPALPTTEGIIAAAANASAAGGGIVKLPVMDLALTESLPMFSNVQYEGQGYKIAWTGNPSNIPDGSGTVVSGGTILRPTGSFPAFAYNADDLGAPMADAQTFANAGLGNTGISKLAIVGGTYGIKLGARHISSCWYSTFSDLYISDCTQWGVWIENFLHCTFRNINVFRCLVGQQTYAMSGGANLAGGNSYWESIYGIVGGNNIAVRNLRWIARSGSIFGSATIDYPQGNRFNQGTTAQAATCANASTSITITDGTKFAVEMPVTFSASVNGFVTGICYFVRSVVGNVITVSDTIDGTAIAATGSTAVNVRSQGFPCIEFVGYDTSKVLLSSVIGLDAEAGGTCKALLHNIGGASGTIEMPALVNDVYSDVDVCVRLSPGICLFTQNNARVDIDASSNSGQYFGSRSAVLNGRPGKGLWKDNNSRLALSLIGSVVPDLSVNTLSGGDVLQLAQPLSFKVTQLGSGTTLTPTHAGVVRYNGAPGGTYTLPVLTTSHNGLSYKIMNPAAGTLTIGTQSSQLFNGKAASTSLVVSANSAVVLTAAQNDWVVESFSGTVTF